MELNSKQRAMLQKMAHHLDPVLMIGKHGMNDSIVRAAMRALDDHELIKVKFVDFKEERHEMSRYLADECDASLVSVIGNIAILFRVSRDPEKQQIKLS
jgi:RNA-binding protein